MKVKKSYLKLAIIVAVLLIVASIGFQSWYSFVLANVAKLSSFSLYFIILFSFIAGVASVFSPCGLALLPAVMSYNLSKFGGRKKVSKKRIAMIGIIAASGILSFYAILGLILSAVGVAISSYIQILQYVFAFLLVALGILMLKNFTISSRILGRVQNSIKAKGADGGVKGFYFFGFGYGLEIIGCLSPLISALIFFPFITGNFTLGIVAFISYGIGLGTMLAIFSYMVVYSEKDFVTNALNASKKIKKWSGYGLIAAGIILLLYYTFFGMTIA